MRGRPPNSQIRNNIIEILHFMGQAYGYDIYHVYCEIFPKVTMRSIYYHLNKGVELGVFKIKTIEQEKGNYSWGETAQKIYYSLDNASPAGDPRVEKYLKNGKQGIN